MSQARDVRKSLPLSAPDVRDLDLMRASREYRRALGEMTGEGIDAGTGEAPYLHAVLTAEITALRERAEDSGYAAMAAQQEPTDDQRRGVARRRTPAGASE